LHLSVLWGHALTVYWLAKKWNKRNKLWPKLPNMLLI
jgi:hypothetical protein